MHIPFGMILRMLSILCRLRVVQRPRRICPFRGVNMINSNCLGWGHRILESRGKPTVEDTFPFLH